jgi:hypothetical protein
MASNLNTAKSLIELFLHLVIKLDLEDLSAFAFDLPCSLLIKAVKVGVVVCFLRFHEA